MKITRKQLIQIIKEEAQKSTIKYNANPALKGDQTKLPDNLQKGIIDKDKVTEDVDDEDSDESNAASNTNESKLDHVVSTNSSKMKITRNQLKRIIKEVMDDPEPLFPKFTPSPESPVDPRFSGYANPGRSRPTKEQEFSNGRFFTGCSGTKIVLPYENSNKDAHDLWNYIIDARGNNSLFEIAIENLLGVDDFAALGAEKFVMLATTATKGIARKFVPIAGQVLLAADIAKTIKEWNKDVSKDFCNVMQLMNFAYWGESKNRYVLLQDWEMYPAYFSLIVQYGRKEAGWVPMKLAQVMVSAGWLHPNEANEFTNKILESELRQIEFKEGTIDYLERSLTSADDTETDTDYKV